MKSKIIYHSGLIQKDIQDVVSNSSALLMNNLKEPFLENSCSNDGDINTFKYFVGKSSSIARHNNEIIEINNLLHDINLLTKATVLFSRRIPNIIIQNYHLFIQQILCYP